MKKQILNINNRSRGQTLIEVVVTLGVALVIISSIVVLVNSSNRRATLSRQATQASKLAQQGMERVRNIADVNDPNAIQFDGSCDATTPCSWSDLYERAITRDTVYLAPPSVSCDTSGASWCLVGSPEEPPIENLYTRTVIVSDNSNPICGETGNIPLGSDDIKRVEVTVTWVSPLGDQERTVVSCIAKWR